MVGYAAGWWGKEQNDKFHKETAPGSSAFQTPDCAGHAVASIGAGEGFLSSLNDLAFRSANFVGRGRSNMHFHLDMTSPSKTNERSIRISRLTTFFVISSLPNPLLGTEHAQCGAHHEDDTISSPPKKSFQNNSHNSLDPPRHTNTSQIVLRILQFSLNNLAIMSPAQDIPRAQKVTRSVSNSFQDSTGFGPLSASPTLTFHGRQGSISQSPTLQRSNTVTKALKPFNTKDIKVLLLENVNKTGQDILRGQGYQVEAIKTSLKEDELIEKIKYAHLLSSWSRDGICEHKLT